ncbi:response regulator transcription factor [Streptomyces sp. NPDC047108]|uniref:response regulator transcription factor n=1 Tax=Streptomyces sp. NPDC047108 TaxID=3155025 RepID=UPI0033FB0CE8
MPPTDAPAIRVLVADDEHLVRAGLRLVLSNADDIEIVAEASDGREAVELARRHRVDVALLDIRMPRLDGLAAAEQLAATAPRTAVLMLTTFSEDENVSRALRAGAAGFLLKDTPPTELIQGVRAAAEGNAIVSPQITRRLLDQYLEGETARTEARERTAELTDRERAVLAMVGTGLSNGEIAQELVVSEGTVKAYVSRILAKLGCENRVQAALLARDAGIRPDAHAAQPPEGEGIRADGRGRP